MERNGISNGNAKRKQGPMGLSSHQGATHLPLSGLVPNEGVLEQLLRVGALLVVLHQHRLNEALELLGPLAGLEPGRRVSRDEEQRPHRVHVAQR